MGNDVDGGQVVSLREGPGAFDTCQRPFRRDLVMLETMVVKIIDVQSRLNRNKAPIANRRSPAASTLSST